MVSKAKLLVLALLLLASAVAFGQAISGDVIGTVVDKTGAVVPAATVTAVNTATGVKATTTSTSSGEYRFGNLSIGTYDITASAKGFATAAVKDVVVSLNKTVAIKVTLAPASVSTQVDVTEAAAAIDTSSAQLQSSYDSKATQDLPSVSVGSGVLNLALLQSGVGTATAVGAGSGPSVGGQRPRNNNFTVEGVDNNDKGVTGPLIVVPNDAVQEFTVLQNQYSPEFGHSTGGQFNSVVVSGTNAFHGRAYDYFQNRNLNGVDYDFARNNPGLTSNPRYDNNRFGGQIGGPVIKNKLFFFFNYTYQPIGQASTPGTVCAPTTAGYNTLSSIAGVSASNVNGLKQFALAPTSDPATCGGAPLVKGQTIDIGPIPIAAPNYNNTKYLVSAADWNIGANDQFRARYLWNKVASIDTSAALPAFFTTLTLPYDLITAAEYHTFSPMVSNELRVGYNRYGYNYTVPGGTLGKFGSLDMFPNLTIDDLGINVGPDPNAPQYSMQNNYQLVDNVTWVKGAHTFKFGVEGRKAISPQLFIQRMRGDYEWGSLEGYALDTATATIAGGSNPNGGLVFAERSLGNAGYSGDQWGLYWFVNDQWKVNQHLTVNLGVRYEYMSTPYGWTQQSLNSVADAPGLITFGSPKAPLTDFMPRVGFAYSPGNSGNTSIRGGFGMGYDVLYDNIGTLSRPPEIGSTTIDCPDNTNPACPASGFLANGGIKPFTGSGTTTLTQAEARAATASYLPNNVEYPYSIQWNLGIQHVFATNYTFEARYVGTRGVHLDVQNRINVQNKVTSSQYLATYIDPSWNAACPITIVAGVNVAHCDAAHQAILDALPTTLTILNAKSSKLAAYSAAGFSGNIVGYMPYGSSIYHGLQTELTRRFSNGLQFKASWTWSHTIDNSTADFFSTIYTPRRQQDFQNITADRSNSALDRTHRVTLTAIYDVPWMKNNKNWVAKNILGNWEFAPIYTFESGEWATVQSGVDSNLNGDSAGDRTIINPSGVSGTGSNVQVLKNTAGATVGYMALTPTAQYIVAGSGALANSGRNTLLTRPIDNFDLTLVKKLNITERFRTEFAIQALNALNHPQFVLNRLNDIASGGTTSSTIQNMLKPSSGNFNHPENLLPSNARAVQLYLKLIF